MRLNSEHPITTENKQKPAEYSDEVAARTQRQRQRVAEQKRNEQQQKRQ